MAGPNVDTDNLLGADDVDHELEGAEGYENPDMDAEPEEGRNIQEEGRNIQQKGRNIQEEGRNIQQEGRNIQQELADVNNLGHEDNRPHVGLWEDVIQENEDERGENEGEEDEPVAGNCCNRCLRGCGKCFNEAWIGCTPLDKALLFMHILIGCCSMGQIVAMAYVKIVSHNQCLLRANYNPDGTMSGGDTFWCDSALYYSLISASLVFLFAMVNWTAQLNNNWRWMQVQLVLNILGTLGQLATTTMFAMSYMVWCNVLRTSMHCNPGPQCPKDREKISTCSEALDYFDSQFSHDRHLQRVKTHSIIAMTVTGVVCVLWVILLGLLIQKFCLIWFDVKRKKKKVPTATLR